MIVTLKNGADAASVKKALAAQGLWVSSVEKADSGHTHYVIASHSAAVNTNDIRAIEGVGSVTTATSEHPRVDAQGSVVDVSGFKVGGEIPALMCGPCSVESEGQIFEIAAALAALKVPFLRGGAFKPRTSPYAFQGHGSEALTWMRKAASAHGLRMVTEALSEADAPVVAEQADLVQVGSRNSQNYALLKAVGKTGKPVLLKRAMSATVDEWLLAGEYLLVHGAAGVIFCERGIRGFDGATRNLLDLGAVALLSNVAHLPVIVDPSHASGRRDLVAPLARAAMAAGAAGVMVEVHDDPGSALSDGPQALRTAELSQLIESLGRRS